jgi:hypothetical protein
MSDLSPYEKLGVTEDASFDEIQEAKKKLTLKYKNDTQVVETIEAAYDAIIMDRLKMRQQGKIKIPDQIRFPEKIVPTKVTSPTDNLSDLNQKTPLWLQNLIDSPTPKEVTISGIIYLILAIISVFNQSNETLPFLLTIGVGASFYFLYQKERLFWRATGITFIAFVLGIGLGSILANAIISSGLSLSIAQDQFASLFTFCVFWLVSNFFR